MSLLFYANATEAPETLAAAEIPVKVAELRIVHLKDACAFINETISTHKDQSAFRSIVDWAIQSCEIEPVELAKAFEVSSGTVSRWRTGKNAPHPRERPRIIAWLKSRIDDRIRELESEHPPAESARMAVTRAAR